MTQADVIKLPTAARRHTTHLFNSLEGVGFDLAAYSRMKFGSGVDARTLGREMADAFAGEFWSVIQNDNCLVLPAPSTTVPVAATLMGWHFKDRLNSLLDYCNRPIVGWDTVFRDITYNDNYSQLELEDRKRLLAQDTRFMNTAYAAGKTLIFVDDVRITGTHEHELSNMLNRLGMDNPVIFATYAAYTGDRPSIEHDLNHHTVKDGLCVVNLATHPEWQVTTRALRLLLELDHTSFVAGMASLTRVRVEQIFHAALAKGYSKHVPYQQNFLWLRTFLKQR